MGTTLKLEVLNGFYFQNVIFSLFATKISKRQTFKVLQIFKKFALNSESCDLVIWVFWFLVGCFWLF